MMPVSFWMVPLREALLGKPKGPRSRLTYRASRRNEAKGFRAEYRAQRGRRNYEKEEEYRRERSARLRARAR